MNGGNINIPPWLVKVGYILFICLLVGAFVMGA